MPSLRDLAFAFLLSVIRVARRLVRPRYVILHGFYGAGNVGDEALLTSSLKQLQNLPRGLTPFVFCQNPERVQADHEVPCLNPARAGRMELARVLLRSKAYLLGGGGLLKDYGKPEARSVERQWLRWLDLARRSGLKTMTWSIGVENIRYEQSKRVIYEVLRRVDVVTVRDEASRDRLRKLGLACDIEVTADPVPALVRPLARKRKRPSRLRIVVCARHWYPYDFGIPDQQVYERVLRAMAQALDYAVSVYGAEVVFLPFRTSARDDDRAVHRAIRSHMHCNGTTFCKEENPTVEQVTHAIAEADLVLGVRLHSIIMATAMGIPAIAIAYMPKVRDYMAMLEQSEFCIDFEEVFLEHLRNLVDQAIDRYEEISEELVCASRSLADEFPRNMQLLNRLLT